MDTNFSERELELMQLRQQRMAEAAGQTTQPAQQAAPAQQTGIASRAFIPSTQVAVPGGETQPSAAQPNTQQMNESVGEAIPGMLKNVAVPAVGAGILAGLAHLLLGGKADTTGDAKAGERRDPLMDVSQKGRIEPTLSAEPQFAPGPVAPTQPVEPKPLSPLEQEDLRLKQLKNQRLELAIQHDKEKAERAKAEYEAKQAKQAAQAKQVAGGTLTETEAKMLAASETAKISKAVIADQKLQQASNARTQVEGAVAPATVAAVENATPAAVAPVAEPATPAKPKQKSTFKSAAEIPEGMIFRPDVGNLDRSLANALGPEHRLYAKELINEGKMFGHSTDVNKDVSRITNEYFKALQQQVPETILSRDARKAQGVESKLGTYGKVLGRGATLAGVAGTLMTMAQSANAKEAANALGEAILPLGATPSELQPGTLTAKQLKAFEEAKKLGSPYRSVPPPKR